MCTLFPIIVSVSARDKINKNYVMLFAKTPPDKVHLSIILKG